ncbi:MAG: flagellar basal body P-ring protein FlgI [Planctomycetota bacterium]
MTPLVDMKTRSETRDAAQAATGVPDLRDARACDRLPAASEVGGCLETTPLRSPRARENDLRVHALAQGSDHAAGGANTPPGVLLLLVLALSGLVFAQGAPTEPARDRGNAKSRVKDIARVQGADSYFIEGIGLVVGLPGTGDSPKELSQKLEAAWLRYRNKIELTPKDLQNKNAAIVSVSAELPAFQQPGTKIDVHIASIADAKSLRGGQLLITKLYGPRPITETDEFYATAQGPLQIDGGAAGNATTAVIPRGGLVRQAPSSTIFERLGSTQSFTLILNRADWNVASKVGEQINGMALGLGEAAGSLDEPAARVLDAGRVRVTVPSRSYGGRAEEFVALVLREEVLLGSTEEPEAAVVINERAGTYAVTGYVTVNPGTAQIGNVIVTIPFKNFAPPVNANARPLKDTKDTDSTVYLNDVLDNLGAVGFGTGDIVSLLKQMDRAGMINGSVRSE